MLQDNFIHFDKKSAFPFQRRCYGKHQGFEREGRRKGCVHRKHTSAEGEVERVAALCLYSSRPRCYCASRMGPHAFHLHLRVYLNESPQVHEVVLVNSLQYAAENLSGCIAWTVEFNSSLTTKVTLYT